MHSFNRGSDVRNPVDLSAYYNKTVIIKMRRYAITIKLSTAQSYFSG